MWYLDIMYVLTLAVMFLSLQEKQEYSDDCSSAG